MGLPTIAKTFIEASAAESMATLISDQTLVVRPLWPHRETRDTTYRYKAILNDGTMLSLVIATNHNFVLASLTEGIDSHKVILGVQRTEDALTVGIGTGISNASWLKNDPVHAPLMNQFLDRVREQAILHGGKEFTMTPESNQASTYQMSGNVINFGAFRQQTLQALH